MSAPENCPYASTCERIIATEARLDALGGTHPGDFLLSAVVIASRQEQQRRLLADYASLPGQRCDPCPLDTPPAPPK
jgi:hypothetical protein